MQICNRDLANSYLSVKLIVDASIGALTLSCYMHGLCAMTEYETSNVLLAQACHRMIEHLPRNVYAHLATLRGNVPTWWEFTTSCAPSPSYPLTLYSKETAFASDIGGIT